MAVTGAIVAPIAAPAVRHLLGFSFRGSETGAQAAMLIFFDNLVFVMACLAAGVAVAAPPPLALDGPRVRLALDVVLGAIATLNVVLVGAAVGAYGTRMLSALLPHGPVELFAYAAAAALYRLARASRLSREDALRLSSLAVIALALAAVLEAGLP